MYHEIAEFIWSKGSLILNFRVYCNETCCTTKYYQIEQILDNVSIIQVVFKT